MKKIVLIFIIINSLSLLAQEEMCYIDDDNCIPNSSEAHFTASTDPIYLATFEPVVYNIYFWVIKRDNGSADDVVTETHVLQNIAKLNIAFNPFNIFFKYRGYNDTDFRSTTHYEGEALGTIYDFAEDEGYVYPNSFNVYIPYSFNNGGGQANYNETYLGVTSGSFIGGEDTFTMQHEVGHSFHLLHPHECYTSTQNCEHVTRIQFDINFNADIRGDRIVDTPAQPKMNDGDIPYIDLVTCQYTGENGTLDCAGDAYQITSDDIANYMIQNNRAFAQSVCKPTKFTIGQGIRAREAIAADIEGKFVLAETTIPSLYEPYRGYYTHIDEPTCTDPPLFQPGFEYRFMPCNCDCPFPTEYDDVSFDYVFGSTFSISKYETDYSTITHPKHTAIGIKHPHPDFWPQPRKCWGDESIIAISGNIIKFNDGVFNANVTITPQDSTQINNPNLVNNLESGLYNIIKIDGNGSTDEIVILKENN